MTTKTTPANFMARVFKQDDGCWVWTGKQFVAGYGRLGANGTYVMAHRYAFESFKGPIPEGLVLDHLCRNRKCVNPEHLEAVTFTENIRRGVAAARKKAMTHCKRGHEYSSANTYLRNGWRICRECVRLHKRNWRRRNGITARASA